MQAEYELIERDLAVLLDSKTEYSTFHQLHPGLQRALNDMDGYTNAESQKLTASERKLRLQNLKEIAQKMTRRIFYGEHHIFYLRVMRVTDTTGNVEVSPLHLEPSVTDRTADYLLQNNCLHVIDITNFCSTEPHLTPNLLLFQRSDAEHNFTLHHPFTLWAPPALPAYRHGMVRLDTVRLTHEGPEHDYELREQNGTVVLALEFRVQSVHGAHPHLSIRGMHMGALFKKLQECALYSPSGHTILETQ